MLWQISETGYLNKGVISEHHKRTIYSVSWCKGEVTTPSGSKKEINLIASGGADNKIMCYEVNKESLMQKDSQCFSFNILSEKVDAHENDVNCVAFNPKNPLVLASCSDDGFVKIWLVTFALTQVSLEGNNYSTVGAQLPQLSS
mmetsp:Transcript_44325/g.32342  ORF Transcript_44325/g.32342 Transcript_44325/m.32342 type:complete len:144 (+) Transcript_44325:528-959(+)